MSTTPAATSNNNNRLSLNVTIFVIVLLFCYFAAISTSGTSPKPSDIYSNTAIQEAKQAQYIPRLNFGAKVLDCKKDEDDSLRISKEFFGFVDFSKRPHTPDQIDMNSWLTSNNEINSKTSILHIGIGDSSVASLVSKKVFRVVGLTVAPGEKSHADYLKISNYKTSVCNKYKNLFPMCATRLLAHPDFDIIIDNNLASFACCQKHLEKYMQSLVDILSPNGKIITHLDGAAWSFVETEKVWAMNKSRLIDFAQEFGLDAEKEDPRLPKVVVFKIHKTSA